MQLLEVGHPTVSPPPDTCDAHEGGRVVSALRVLASLPQFPSNVTVPEALEKKSPTKVLKFRFLRPKLLQTLKDSDHVVRRCSAVSLGRIGCLGLNFQIWHSLALALSLSVPRFC